MTVKELIEELNKDDNEKNIICVEVYKYSVFIVTD